MPIARVSVALFCALIATLSGSPAVQVRYAGQSCNTGFQLAVLSRCAGGLICQNNICRLNAGRKCAGRESLCDNRLVCAGSDETRCLWPRSPGAWCKDVPCRKGLLCRDNRCRIPVNGDCTAHPSTCVKGAVCAGDKDKRCITSLVGEGGNCLIEGARCHSGLRCEGTADNKICVAPSRLRGPCGTPFEVCEDGLACNQATRKCRDGTGQPGSRCNENRPCSPGLVCRSGGAGGLRTTCIILRDAGGLCKDGSESQCKSGLRCKGGVCV